MSEQSGPFAHLVGSVLSERYQIRSLLGEGGMGAVFEGEHLLMHKRVAIKLLHPDVSQTGEMVQRFEREAMAAAHIDHPNVVTATDFGRTPDGACFLVLEYVEGRNLREILADSGAMPPERALRIIEQVASVLVKAHGLGIVHRDLKPENVMLVERDGDPDFVKVLDFGIAKVPVESMQGQQVASPQGLTKLGVMYGTPEYMAPEQAMGTGVDHRADLYALGVMLFEMLSGERPFVADNVVSLVTMHIVDPVPRLADRRPDLALPAGLDDLVHQLLAKDREVRPATARDLIDRMRALRGDAVVTPGPGPASLSSSGEVAMAATGIASAVQPVPASVGSGAMPTVPGHVATPVLSEVAGVSAQTTAGLPGVELAAGAGGEPRWRRELRELGPALETLRSQLPGPLGRVPLVAYAAGIGLVFVVLLAVGLRPRPRPPEVAAPAGSASAAPAGLDEAAIDEAAKAGAAPLEALAERFPNDARVLRALVKLHHEAHRPAEALKALARLAKLVPEVGNDELTLPVIKAGLDGPAEATDQAFDLLEEGLGEPGLSILYALWTSTAKDTSPKHRARAGKALTKPETKARASKAMQALIELNVTPASCETRRSGAQLALEAGDRRAVPLLQRLTAKKGCGFLSMQDCWPCLRRDTLVADALKAADKRPEP